jgi:hypothetical protein
MQWVMECVTTAPYFVRFNGVLLDTIQPTWALQQGDMSSPDLFHFVVDGLYKVLKKEASNGLIQGVKVCTRDLEITQLLFADDSLVFFQANRVHASSVKGARERYSCRGTGQLINFDKCSILFIEKQTMQLRSGSS